MVIYKATIALVVTLWCRKSLGVRDQTVEMTKLLIILMCCTYTLASHHASHIIPVENYETELQDLGQHTEAHETPVKVIKITKTIAVKIPVPYPVKVIEKVPYPVQVNKPYPVHVPHVIQLPKERKIELRTHHENAGGHENHSDSYQVQEGPGHDAPSGPGHAFGPLSGDVHVNEGGFNYGNHQHLTPGNDYSQGAPGNAYDAPVRGFHEYAGDDGHSYDDSKFNPSKSYL